MLSRREVLMGGVAAGAAALARQAAPAPGSQPSTRVTFDVPSGACDCHAHIFGDPQRFPFAPERVYTPPTASVEELAAFHRALRIDRVVIVHPSVYGTDNSCTLAALQQIGARARGVAVIDDRTPDAALGSMARAGIRGLRLNLETAGQTDPAVGRRRFQVVAARAASRAWHVQIYTRPSVIEGIRDLVLASPIPVVFDHFGGAQGASGVDQPGFATLLDLIRSGKAYVKISGPYRGSTAAPDFRDMAPLAKAIIAANPERVLWGTDWPHPDSAQVPGRTATDIAPFHRIDDGRVLNQLAVWAPDAAVRRMILVDNPGRLYGF